jgi:hypothetical protein
VPRIVREADVAWEGNLARGAGSLTAATSGAFTGLPYSLAAAVEAADRGCPFSALLRAAGVGIDTTTSLEGGH